MGTDWGVAVGGQEERTGTSLFFIFMIWEGPYNSSSPLLSAYLGFLFRSC